MATQPKHDVIIIGAGIIGLAIAHYVQQTGRKVTLVDRKGVAQEASFGNAGAFALADIFPLASPGIMRKAPKWLLDPLGPLSVRPQYALNIVPYLLKFFRASWPDQHRKSIVAQSALLDLAASEVDRMAQIPQIGNQIRTDGALHLYESEREFAASQSSWQARQEFGIEFEHLDATRLADLQPGLSNHIKRATFIPKWQTVNDPFEFAQTLWRLVQQDGGELIEQDVKAISQAGEVTLQNGETLSANHLVVAAGAWSHQLAKQVGDHIPLESERGYNTTLPAEAFDLKRQLIFGEHGFVMTPLSTGIRVGGAVEFAGLDAAPNFKRSEIMLQKAKRFMPDLKTEQGTQWMGFRPSLPDTLPAIGKSAHTPNISYAFGHGHLGLTQCFATGKLMAELIDGQAPSLDLTPFNPSRF
ncbi:glycine/D-amino acid oxidase-like deaminating enzyme [Maritalea mobilis]|uniref:Glycine/D-amino acid oxidase-like deaminating enzyme n=1 Tax=Maritalea mobilis TaxID=483324 RepID=A0A4R6VKY2_9HYPH|nr:FAD-dependent oxidoreductase [Maritalea mobilis]TDQ63757.1 glycine/D-amino acid oxidase-like deaminating enzyme [Maritalea mobilis]